MPSISRYRWLPLGWTALSIVVGVVAVIQVLWIFISTLNAQVHGVSPLPYYDQWPFLRQYMDVVHRGLRPSDLWAQWNEHRLVLPRLVFLADLSLFKGSNYFDVAVTDVMQVATIAMIIYLCSRVGRSLVAVLSGCFAIAALTNSSQYENFYWGFQVQFVAVYTFAIAAVFLGGKSARTNQSPIWRIASILAAWLMACLASVTMANGLFAFFALGTGLMLCRDHRGLGIFTVVLGGVLLAVYLVGFEPVPGHTPISHFASRPVDALRYFLTYLGSLMAPDSPAFAQAFGLAIIAIWSALFVVVVIRRQTLGEAGFVAVAGICFILMSALATTLGRFEFGLYQALSSRYFTPVAILWSLTVLLAADILSSLGRAATVPMVVLLSAALLRLSLYDQPKGLDYFNAHALNMASASSAFVVGAHDDKILSIALPGGESTFEFRPLLLARGLSVFADQEVLWLGRKVSQVFELEKTPVCVGSIDTEAVFPKGGTAMMGWAWDGGIPNSVVFADRDGNIVGYGAVGYQRPDVPAAAAMVKSPFVGWYGHIAPKVQKPISAYAISSDSRHACRFAERL